MGGGWCTLCLKTGLGRGRLGAVRGQHKTVAALLNPSRILQSFVLRIRHHMSKLQGLLLAVTDFWLSGRA